MYHCSSLYSQNTGVWQLPQQTEFFAGSRIVQHFLQGFSSAFMRNKEHCKSQATLSTTHGDCSEVNMSAIKVLFVTDSNPTSSSLSVSIPFSSISFWYFGGIRTPNCGLGRGLSYLSASQFNCFNGNMWFKAYIWFRPMFCCLKMGRKSSKWTEAFFELGRKFLK